MAPPKPFRSMGVRVCLLLLMATESAWAAITEEAPYLDFSRPVEVEGSDGGALATVAADFDGDGIDEIVSAASLESSDPHLRLYDFNPATRQMSTRELLPPGAIAGPAQVRMKRFGGGLAVGDLDLDGDLDLIVPDSGRGGDDGSGSLSWFRNPGPGNADDPWEELVITAWSGSGGGDEVIHVGELEVGDLDGNGWPDIVTRDISHGMFLHLREDDGVGWKLRRFLAVNPREGLKLADLSGDGRLDIIINGIWLETPANPLVDAFVEHAYAADWYPGSTGSAQIADYACQIAIADFNGDGRTDIAISNAEELQNSSATASKPDGIRVFLAPPDPRVEPWTEVVLEEEHFSWHTLQAGDLDGDGDIDLLGGISLVGRDNAAPRALAFLNDGTGTFFAPREFDGPASQPLAGGGDAYIYNCSLGDFDGDGDPDLFAPYDWNSGQTRWYENGWQSGASMLLPRSGACLIDAAGSLLVVGGELPTGEAAGWIERLDPSSGSWLPESEIPTPRLGGVAVFSGSEVWLLGGVVPPSTSGVVECEVYDPASSGWRAGPALPEGVRGAMAAVVNGRIHLVGGIDDTAAVHGRHWVLDLATESGWTSAAGLPLARQDACMVALDGRLHVIGGRSDPADPPDGGHWVYDPAGDDWTVLAGLPQARSCGPDGALAHAGSLWSVVGSDPGASPAGQTAVLRYDAAADAWQEWTRLPFGRVGAAVEMLGDEIHVAGGWLGEDGFGAANLVNRYELLPTVPSPPPTGLVATSPSSSSVRLDWLPLAGNAEEQVVVEIPQVGEPIERARLGPEAASLVLDGHAPGTDLQFRVSAVNLWGESVASNLAAVTTLPVDEVPPSAPGYLTPLRASAVSIELAWMAASDNIGVAGYQVFADGAWIGNSPTTQFLANGLEAGGSYEFTVRAVDAEGNVSAPCEPAVMHTVASVAFESDLLARWDFEEGIGTQAADPYGDNTGSLTGSAAWAGGLNGAGSGVEITDNSGRIDVAAFPVGGAQLTLAAWFRPNGFDGYASEGRIISRATSPGSQDHYWMLGNGGDGTALRFRLKTDDGVTTTLLSDNGMLEAGKWSHVAASFDGSAMRLFLDANLIAETQREGGLASAGSVPVGLGNQPSGAGERAVDGVIDSVAVFGTALDAADLEVVMGTAPGNPDVRTWLQILGMDPATALTDDSDRDDSPLLLEYALGMDPRRVDFPPITGGTSAGNGEFRFLRMRGELDYIVEFSPDMIQWQEDPTAVVVGGLGELNRVRFPEGRQSFARLKLTAPPAGD